MSGKPLKTRLSLSLAVLLSSSLTLAQANADSLEINLTLPEITTGQYHRPYTAVWVEDAKGQSVRTLSLWVMQEGEGYKWLKDIRRWWRKAGRDDMNFVDAIASATRPAGKYPISWDLKDDQGGQVANGKYTLLVEVVREHGGRDLVRHKFQLDGKPFKAEIAPTIETGTISLQYLVE